MSVFTSICLLSLLSLVASSPLASGQPHSLEKRQTTVTFNGKYEDIHELITNLVVAFTFATAVVVVALPLFGYKLSLVTEALGSSSSAEDDSLGTDPTAGEFSSYGAPPAYEGYARSLASSLVSRFSKTSTSHGSPKLPEVDKHIHNTTQHTTKGISEASVSNPIFQPTQTLCLRCSARPCTPW